MPIDRACDACKRRKVRCDADSPCANCRISQLRCEYRIPPRKRGRRPKGPPAASPKSPVILEHVHAQGRGAVAAADDDGGVFLAGPENHASPGMTLPEPLAEPLDHFRQDSYTSSIGRSPINVTAGLGVDRETTYDAARIYTELVTVLSASLASGFIEDVMHNCVDLYVQYIFPTSPIAHEPTLRAAISLFPGASSLPGMSEARHPFSESSCELTALKSFTLITALCAFVLSIVPDSFQPQRRVLAGVFLQFSKAMLRTYEDYDIEHPDSTSLTIRMWLSAASQNATGKAGAAWRFQGEAVMLAQRLRLHDELFVVRDSILETQLLRATFWALYLSEKATAAIENRPVMLHELLFKGDLTLRDHGENEEPLLDESKKVNQQPLQSRLAVGFHLKRRMWTAAADLVVEIKWFARRQKQGRLTPDGESLELARLTDAALDYTGMLDELPQWLRHPENLGDFVGEDIEVSVYQRTCFWVQRSNITTVFHCTSLVILQKCIDHDIPSIIGLNDNPLSWAARKLEIVQNFLQELQRVPFICLKVQGEAAVERIRHVGSIVLEMVHNASKESIKERARSHFAQLLDILAKLDSRACDELSVLPGL